MRRVLLCLLPLLAACTESWSQGDAGDSPPPTAPDGGPEDAGSPGQGDGGIHDATEFLSSCQGLPEHCSSMQPNARCGQCQYRIRFDTRACSPQQRCDNLLLLWAAMDCAESNVQAALDRALAGRTGWVAACAQPAYPGEMLPSTLGAPGRDEAVMTTLLQALRSDPVAGVWSGKNVLMTGCSAGATRYPVVAARTTADGQWLGTGKSGVCMSDGVYSLPYQDAFIGAGLQAAGTSCGPRHRRIAEGYTVASATAGHACTGSPQGQCGCDPAHATRTWASSCGDGDCMSYDSIVVETDGGFGFATGVTSADFAVPHWKLISEGSAHEGTATRCEKDIVPEAPLSGLCQLLEAGATTSCTFRSFPAAPHCSAYWQSLGTECLDWFEAL